MKKFSIRWKLVFVAAAALALALAAPLWSVPTLAQASMFVPALELAPPGHFAERPQVWMRDSTRFIQTYLQPKTPQQRTQSPTNTAARPAAIPDDLGQERRLSPGAILGLICAIAASSVALGIAFGLRRRIDRIAGPDPDKTDDD